MANLFSPVKPVRKYFFLHIYATHRWANNELSLAVTTFLAKRLLDQKDRKYSYRIIFIPETIGTIVYLSQNLPEMKTKIIAGLISPALATSGPIHTWHPATETHWLIKLYATFSSICNQISSVILI